MDEDAGTGIPMLPSLVLAEIHPKCIASISMALPSGTHGHMAVLFFDHRRQLHVWWWHDCI
jgi:hypothetical protein